MKHLSIDDLGRVEVIDIQTGNGIASFHIADNVMAELVKFNVPLATVRLEWHSEEADKARYGLEEAV